jgi:hypothetical protein
MRLSIHQPAGELKLAALSVQISQSRFGNERPDFR